MTQRTFGRCVGKAEGKAIKRDGTLSDSQGALVPVFDGAQSILQKLSNMSSDQVRNYFRGIGVRNPHEVVLFQTDTAPVAGPIPQSNGLREYKFSSGSPVRYVGSMRA
jgi:hypothetical protein